MKNVIRGGLRSLIPHRDVEDPDDVLDDFEDDDFEEVAEADEVEEVEAEEAEAPVARKVAIVKEDEGENENSSTPQASEEPEDLPSLEDDDGDDMVVPPSKPLVTPLTLDEETGVLRDPTVSRTRAVHARQITGKPKTVKAKITREAPVKAKAKEKATVTEQPEMWDQHEGDVQHVELDNIRINPNQPRRKFDPGEMEELKQSIAQHGILQPLVVRRMKDGYELIAGERRLRAARDLKWGKVPCVVRRGVSSGASQLELALIENIQRQDLNPVEEALALKQLNEEYGMTHEEIGERVGRSRVGVTNIIRLLQLPEEIRKGLIDGKITSGHAKAILMIPDDDKQLRFYRHLVDEGLTVRKAETRARRIQRTMQLDDPMREKRKGRSTFEVKYSGLLEDRYGYDSKLKFNEQKNRFEVIFKCHSKEEIDELLARLMGTEPLPEGQDKDVMESDEELE